MLKNLHGKFVQENSKKFITFLKECFSLTSRAAKKSVEVPPIVINAIVDCFNAYVVKLSEEQLRPCILRVTKWAMKAKGELEFDFHRALIFTKLLCGVFETLKEFFVPQIFLHASQEFVPNKFIVPLKKSAPLNSVYGRSPKKTTRLFSRLPKIRQTFRVFP